MNEDDGFIGRLGDYWECLVENIIGAREQTQNDFVLAAPSEGGAA